MTFLGVVFVLKSMGWKSFSFSKIENKYFIMRLLGDVVVSGTLKNHDKRILKKQT